MVVGVRYRTNVLYDRQQGKHLRERTRHRMSAMGDRNVDKRAKKRRYTEKRERFANWAISDAEQLRDTIAAVSSTGCAIRFGYSKDGGAYCIGIIGDGDPYTVWAGDHEELDIKLKDLEASFHDGEIPEDHLHKTRN